MNMKRSPRKKTKQLPSLRKKSKLIQVNAETYLVGAKEDEVQEERPIILAWLNNYSSDAPEQVTEKVYKQLYDEIFEPNPERSKVVTLHLYVEYWLDSILDRVSIVRPSTFFKKAVRLNEIGSFTEDLYQNILKINQLRNIYAHELDLKKAYRECEDLISKMKLDPYFVNTDADFFRAICIQTMFALESIYNNNGKPITSHFPAESVREKLKANRSLHWQECELVSKEKVSTYIERVTMRCPLCGIGTIVREKDSTPGFRDSFMTKCKNCGLSGDGSYLELATAER